MEKLLPQIDSPHDLASLTLPQLERLAAEMREALCHLVTNLGPSKSTTEVRKSLLIPS